MAGLSPSALLNHPPPGPLRAAPPKPPPPQLSAPALLNHPPPGPLRAGPPSGGFAGGIAHAIGSVGQATQQAARSAATPHNSPSPGSDIQASGAGYGAAQANAFKQTPAYRQAIVDTFLHQSYPQQQAIAKGALKMPSYEGSLVLNYLRSSSSLGKGRPTPALGGLLTPHENFGLGDVGKGILSTFGKSDLQKLTAKIGGPTSPAGLLKTTGGAGVRALGALSQPSDLQKLTAKIGGATSPQDVLRVGGAVGSALINAIPTRKPYGPAEQIAAQQQGMVPGGIGKHLLQGAINTPAEVFPSMAIPIGEALNNHWGQAIKSFTGPYAQMFHSPKAFEQFVYNNPFQAALMFQGVTHPAATALDTAQSVVRGKGIPNVIPESVHLTGNLTHERPNFSRSPITRRAQKDVAKQIYKRNPRTGQLVPRSYAHSTHLIRMETSRMVGQANRVRAVGHAEQLVVIYALLDCQPAVREEHLRAAAAVWRYCEESARFVFGDALGYRMADKLRRSLRDAQGAWLSREEIRKAAGSNNIPAEELDAALDALLDHGLAERKSEPTGGRPAELWRSTDTREEWEESPAGQTLPALSSHSSHPEEQRNGRGPLATPEEEALLERATQLIGGDS